jgi:hypothetical protein
MRSAFGTAISTAEVAIPCLHEPRMIFFNHFLNAVISILLKPLLL